MGFKRQLSDESEKQIIVLYATGLSCMAVGKRFDRGCETVKRVLHRHGVQLRRTGEYINGKKTGQPVSAEARERARTASGSWWKSAKQKNPAKMKIYALRQRARTRGIVFDLTEKDIVIPEFCPVLGIRLAQNRGKYGPADNSPTVDRINPLKGYVKGNVQVISDKANRIKSNATLGEIEKVLAYMKKIAGVEEANGASG